MKSQLKSENGLQVTAIDANKLWTWHDERLNYPEIKREKTHPSWHWWQIFVCQRDQERETHYTTINKYDIT